MTASITEFRQFGRTGVKVSPLTLGCMMFGRRTEPAESFRIIDRALDAGINFLDTANGYTRGRSEEIVGDALKSNGKRSRVFLATKVHFPMADDDPNQQGVSRRHIIEQAEASLRRLKTDYIDLYQIHRPHPEVAIDETLRALDDLVRAGKVRYIGSSTFAAWQVVEALWASKELHLNRFVSEQPPYNLLDRRIERELLPAARTFGLAVLPWSPLGGGLLTGKYRRGQPIPEDARYAPANLAAMGQRAGTRPSRGSPASRYVDKIYDVVEPLVALAAERNVPLSQLALAWVVAQPGVTSPIIGPRTFAQLEDALSSLQIRLTPEDYARIDEIIPPGTHVSPFYEADHAASLYRW